MEFCDVADKEFKIAVLKKLNELQENTERHSGYLSEENENRISKRYPHPHVHWSIIHNSQEMETI